MELAKTTPQQRAEIYEDVKQLLVPGFLAHGFSIGPARFVMRSIDREDWTLLQYRTNGLQEREWRAWCVATSIWMVNGSLLRGDENATYDLYGLFYGLPRGVLDTLYSILNGLMRRVIEASDRVEGYLYEEDSRTLWRTEGRAVQEHRQTRPVQRFHNPIISLWAYYNQMEDLREAQEHEWTLAKFAVSPHAPKSVKKLNAQDNKRVADMKRNREGVLDRVYYEAKGLLTRKGSEKEDTGNRPFQQVIMAETEEDLRESMRRWVAGIKDDHDSVVDNVKARIKHGVEQRKEDNRKRREALDRALEEEGFVRNQLTPLAGDAGRQFLERMQSRIPGAKRVYNDQTHNSAYQKYIENNPEIGDLHLDDEGNLVASSPVTEEMLEVLTKPDQQQTLQEQVQSRRPTATFSEEGEE
jgi:hypothetical protein